MQHVHPVTSTEPCIECEGEGYTVGVCCPEPEPCMYRGVRFPCEECATGAAFARDNGWPETLFAIGERKARAALR